MKTIVWMCILIIVIASGISYFLYRTPLQKQSADHIISEEQEKTNSKHLLLAIVTPEYDKSMGTPPYPVIDHAVVCFFPVWKSEDLGIAMRQPYYTLYANDKKFGGNITFRKKENGKFYYKIELYEGGIIHYLPELVYQNNDNDRSLMRGYDWIAVVQQR